MHNFELNHNLQKGFELIQINLNKFKINFHEPNTQEFDLIDSKYAMQDLNDSKSFE